MKTKKENVRNKSSARRKLIPAISMLTVSAIMLSTATYAWFTMNKEVQMTGLNMTATTGEGMEIAIGEIGEGDALTAGFSTQPSDTSTKSWSSSVVVGNYYEKIGLVAPASSVNGTNFYDAKGATNGGRSASEYIALSGENVATVTTERNILANSNTVGTDDSNGYYVDIPVHLRTSKVKEQGEDAEENKEIYYKMYIDDNDPAAKDLYKAVRVKFIPSTGDTLNQSAETPIMAINNENYTADQAVGTSGNLATVTVNTTGVFDSDTSFESGTGANSGLKIAYAENAGTYGHLDFTIRVWLEGESKYCNDDTAGQSWNINFKFSMGQFASST